MIILGLQGESAHWQAICAVLESVETGASSHALTQTDIAGHRVYRHVRLGLTFTYPLEAQ